MKFENSYRSSFSIVLPIGLLFSIFLFYQWQPITQNIEMNWNSEIDDQTASFQYLTDVDNKQKGAHVFGYLDSVNVQQFVDNNIEWITLVSYSSQKDFDSPTLTYFRGDSLDMIRRESSWKTQIDFAHSAGLKVFMKPHIWIGNPSNGKWRSDIFPENESNWNQWKKNYRAFILLYAKIAAENNVEMFCIGTELSRLTAEKPEFWKSLIQDIRSVYSGKITYAANWYKEYDNITFWNELDFIGVQAYFPLVKNKNPSIEQISKGWNKYLSDLESISKKFNRKILFTEMGYKSTADSAIKPWLWIEDSPSQEKSFSLETQANCYKAFFNTVWQKDWFAGVHIWQLRSDFAENKTRNNLDFTPQAKPAEIVIANGFE